MSTTYSDPNRVARILRGASGTFSSRRLLIPVKAGCFSNFDPAVSTPKITDVWLPKVFDCRASANTRRRFLVLLYLFAKRRVRASDQANIEAGIGFTDLTYQHSLCPSSSCSQLVDGEDLLNLRVIQIRPTSPSFCCLQHSKPWARLAVEWLIDMIRICSMEQFRGLWKSLASHVWGHTWNAWF